MTIADQLITLRARIHSAALKAGRDPASIHLLAASKRTDAEGIRESIEAGQLLFGENRAQSLRDKFDLLSPGYPDAEWHFIGHLQKNKIKYVVGRATLVHTIDSIALASALDGYIDRTGKPPIGVLAQVKLGQDPNKTGCPPESLFDLCEHIHNSKHLNLKGLMNIPPQEGNPEKWFSTIAKLGEAGKEAGFPLDILSMGMSGDLEEAIACGATIIRVGRFIYQPKT
jgi:PLP dependent protein